MKRALPSLLSSSRYLYSEMDGQICIYMQECNNCNNGAADSLSNFLTCVLDFERELNA